MISFSTDFKPLTPVREMLMYVKFVDLALVTCGLDVMLVGSFSMHPVLMLIIILHWLIQHFFVHSNIYYIFFILNEFSCMFIKYCS